MFRANDRIVDFDPDVASAISAEQRRQEEHIELIASENIVSRAVLEAAGFGMPDTRYGQEVMACVALKPGAICSERELSELLESRLGSFKKPKRIFFMQDLPKGPSGKIQRLKLSDLVQQQVERAS